MDTDAPARKHEPTPPTDPPAGCDPAAIDDLICEASGVTKRSEVITESLAVLQERQTRFGTAYRDYEAARVVADKAFEDGRKAVLDDKRDKKNCLSDSERDCLEDAMGKVRDEIKKCAGPGGCPPLDYTFDTGLDRDEGYDTPATLTGRAHEYRTIAEELKLAFDGQIGEIEALGERATKYTTDVAALAGTEPDHRKRYATILVLLYRYDQRFKGFASSRSYADCLCKLLSQLLEAWKAIAVLEAAAAYRECCAAKRKDRCDALVDDPVAAVLERCEDEPADDGNGNGNGSSEHPPDCGCGKAA